MAIQGVALQDVINKTVDKVLLASTGEIIGSFIENENIIVQALGHRIKIAQQFADGWEIYRRIGVTIMPEVARGMYSIHVTLDGKDVYNIPIEYIDYDIIVTRIMILK